VIVVAYCLDTIPDLGYVAVMHNGFWVGWNESDKLLQKDSAFQRLYIDMKGFGEGIDET